MEILSKAELRTRLSQQQVWRLRPIPVPTLTHLVYLHGSAYLPPFTFILHMRECA